MYWLLAPAHPQRQQLGYEVSQRQLAVVWLQLAHAYATAVGGSMAAGAALPVHPAGATMALGEVAPTVASCIWGRGACHTAPEVVGIYGGLGAQDALVCLHAARQDGLEQHAGTPQAVMVAQNKDLTRLDLLSQGKSVSLGGGRAVTTGQASARGTRTQLIDTTG